MQEPDASGALSNYSSARISLVFFYCPDWSAKLNDPSHFLVPVDEGRDLISEFGTPKFINDDQFYVGDKMPF